MTQFKWSMAGAPAGSLGDLIGGSAEGRRRPDGGRRPELPNSHPVANAGARATGTRTDLGRNRQHGAHAGHAAVRRGDGEASPHQERAFAHPEQAESFVRVVGVEAATVVIDLSSTRSRKLLDLQGHQPALACLTTLLSAS